MIIIKYVDKKSALNYYKDKGASIILENINYSLQDILNGAARTTQNYSSEKSNINKLVAMCFVPMQEWEQIYDEDTAYSTGTIFPSLNKPFLGGGR